MLSEQKIRDKLSVAIPNVHNVIITDTSNGCGQSFDVIVVSDTFQGKNKIQRCRLVNTALKEEVAQIHAFGCKCFTLEEWSKLVV
ncbi:LANO_0D01552g1_1 [Lachancea nothofagi CBS 11611]|uniref:LANO_0D01552g1_1 n=1 Tax=Lachancea nothofagi CBS 11611 TaxID=1266666 RepID=A0A1G4JDI0_9SACH|nr:LANO_0D01552g1_1 [Lachancea nothofagi CBS 11611]